MNNSIEKAKETVTRLEADLVAATDRATALQTERRKLSFRAHSGDAEARTALEDGTSASTTAALEIENVKFSIEEAKDHVAAAEREVAVEKKREDARLAKVIIFEAGNFSEVMATGLDMLCDSLTGFSAALNKLERLEYPVARERLRYLAYTRAVQNRLYQAGLGFDIVAPYLRHSLDQLNQMYLGPSRDKVAEDLGEAVADAVEAA
jgi:hypothetical protein